jgi:signal transduction histidine kinase
VIVDEQYSVRHGTKLAACILQPVTAPDVSGLTPLITSAARVVSTDDLGEVLQTLVAQAKKATGARYGAIGVVGYHDVLTEFIYDGIDADQAAMIGHPPVGRGVLGTVIRKKEPITLDEISQHPDSVGFPEHHPDMHSFLGVPVAVGDDVFGNLYLTNKNGGFTDRDLEVATALSRIAGAAVQTARLQRRLRRVAIVEDRQRIARDLHDSVIQDIFATGLTLQGLASRLLDDDATELLNHAIDTLDRSVNSLRSYVFELKESTHSPMGLDERLQQLTARMGATYPAQVELNIEGEVPDEWDEELLILATEALSNALRHSHADSVTVDLVVAPTELTLRVEDNGDGFDPSLAYAGMGLSNMAARTKGLGGDLQVESEPGKGTVVKASIPLNHPRQR